MITLDAAQVAQLPLHVRDQFLAWLHDVAPPQVAANAFHLAIYEGCVEVTFYLHNDEGHRYVDAGTGQPAQLTWQSDQGVPLPPEEAVRLAQTFKGWT